MKSLDTCLFLFILGISIPKCFTLPPGVGFGTGTLDLGGLYINQIRNFTQVYETRVGGIDDAGANFYEPNGVPKGFYMLGSYGHSKNVPGARFVLVAQDNTGDILKPPIDYSLVLPINNPNQGTAFFWVPIPPSGYVAVGNVVTGSPEKPPLDKVRCVRSDFVDIQGNGQLIWSAKDNKSTLFNLYSSMTEGLGNTKDLLVPTGTFYANTVGPAVAYLKNAGGKILNMPGVAQVGDAFLQYAPVVYFHPYESFFPATVEWFFQNGALLYTKGKPTGEPVNPTGSNLPQGGTDDGLYWLDLPLDPQERLRVKMGNLDGAAAYLHVKPTVGTTCTDIVVYMFYPFNGPASAKVEMIDLEFDRMGEHVGDWEHFTLRINNFNGELKSMYLSQHAKGLWVDKTQLEYQGSKPVIYASLHGHAAFHQEGVNLVGTGGLGLRNDAGKGKMFDTAKNPIYISSDYLFIIEPKWLNYARHWGPTIVYDISIELQKASKFLVFDVLKKKYEAFLNRLPPEIMGQEGPAAIKFKDNWNGDER